MQFLAEDHERSHNEKYCNGRAKNDANAKSKDKHQKQFRHHGATKENTKYKDHIGKRVIVTEYDICGTLRYLGHPSAGCVLLCGIETVISGRSFFLLIFEGFCFLFTYGTIDSFRKIWQATVLVRKQVFSARICFAWALIEKV